MKKTDHAVCRFYCRRHTVNKSEYLIRIGFMKKLSVTILKILVFFIGWAVLSGIIDIPVENPALWRFFAELIPFAVIVAFTIVFLFREKGEISIPVRDPSGKGIMIGCAVGICWIGIVSGVLLLSHQLTIVGKNSVSMLWLWILSAFINTVMQELLVRGYIYQLVRQRYSLAAAIIVTTALFTLMHGGAFEAGILPVINVITMCLFTTALYEAENTLAAPVMAHAVWNIVGGIFLGGVSLADDYPHLLTLRASANTLLSGGTYMIESSIITLVVNILLLMVFCRKIKSEENY